MNPSIQAGAFAFILQQRRDLSLNPINNNNHTVPHTTQQQSHHLQYSKSLPSHPTPQNLSQQQQYPPYAARATYQPQNYPVNNYTQNHATAQGYYLTRQQPQVQQQQYNQQLLPWQQQPQQPPPHQWQQQSAPLPYSLGYPPQLQPQPQQPLQQLPSLFPYQNNLYQNPHGTIYSNTAQPLIIVPSLNNNTIKNNTNQNKKKTKTHNTYNTDIQNNLTPTLSSKMSSSSTSSSSSNQIWFCEGCDKEFSLQSAYDAHCANHQVCRHPGCTFTGMYVLFYVYFIISMSLCMHMCISVCLCL